MPRVRPGHLYAPWMNPTQVEDTSAADETPEQQRLREHEEAETRRKADAAAYETQRRQDSADAESRRRMLQEERDRR